MINGNGGLKMKINFTNNNSKRQMRMKTLANDNYLHNTKIII